ncbi:MAG: type II toxin-antitoxin system VapC family toxin [Actinomycetota bacterium]
MVPSIRPLGPVTPVLSGAPVVGRVQGLLFSQAKLQRKGVTLHAADAIVAGTARAHGAVLITDNLSDFPISDIVVEGLPFS